MPASKSRDAGPDRDTGTGVTLTLAEPVGMITLRGDPGTETLVQAIRDAIGCAVPEPRRIEFGDDGSVAWMSHDELLISVPRNNVETVLAELDDSLGGEDVLLADVSDARVMVNIRGPSAREVLARGCPSNLSREAFGPGDFIRTRLGQVPVAVWMPDQESVSLMCFRSVGEFVENWLGNAAIGPFPGYLDS